MRKPVGRPQIVAHRGSTMQEAEHTLAAYELALAEGADALECDVRLTADGHLICVHDRRIDRTTGQRGVISRMTWSELRELDAAGWKHRWADLDDEAETPDPETHSILSFQRLLELVRDYDRHVELAIETKHPTRYAGFVEQRLVETLSEFGWAGRDAPVRVMSFSGVALSRVQRLAPELELVLIFDSLVAWQLAGNLLDPDWIAGPCISELRERPRLARRLTRQGRRLHVWTVNDAEDLQLCLDLDVEAVITDVPGVIADLLR